jgi:hypothetical protein
VAGLLLLAVLVGVTGGCSGKKSNGKPDGGTCASAAPAQVINGQACGCDADCTSGFCTDGVCCNARCGETCMACNISGSLGVCAAVPPGDKPRTDALCPASDVSSCGLDGTCDGSGACRRYVAGTVCTPGTCEGATVSGIDLCDGQGRCKPGPATPCVPYNCDPRTRACATTCGSDADCANGVRCVNGSCGPKRTGATCAKDADCASGFCADSTCCNVACKAGCISCNQPGREGTCWPVEANKTDPHGVCHDDGQASCGQTGRCDGLGSCARYAAETICVSPVCAGDRLMTAGTCNGLGTCRTPGIQICAPFKCNAGAAACVSRCTADADCTAGNVCQNGSCGPKPVGQSCQQGSECASGNCVDGVCCESACAGACRSCALPSAMGFCKPLAAGMPDLRGVCVDRGASSCNTDGRCDGGGSCRRYAAGTVCAAEHCENGVATPESLCTASGACVAPDAMTCAPYACNGSRCFQTCSADNNCASGNVCTNTSCGKKPPGASCSDKSECASNVCAQGVCCTTTCSDACKSCALAATKGTCTNVPTNMPDPSEMCAAMAASSCGTNGLCTAGACQRYPQGTACRGASCAAGTTTVTPTATCDGAGVCVMPAATSCFPYRCDVVPACRSTCATNNDCAPPAVCNGTSCGLKPPGSSCGGNDECASNVCTEGVCCATACTGTCMSCAVVGSLGTCTAVPAGKGDPGGRCADMGSASCGTNGLCDGAGACQRYAAGVECVGPSCPATGTTATLARTCDGAGVCKPATTQSCAPYGCNGTTCIAACGSDGDCAPNNVCNTGMCGKKRLGQQCGAGTECDSGNCVDGVCCSASSCGTCLSCAVAGKAGSCQPIAAGDMDTMNRCTAAPPCGFTGRCDGAGACQYAPTSTSCGTATCTGASFTPVGNCDGAGACKQTSTSCGHYVCGAGACLTTCTRDQDCVTGETCQANSCTSLKPLGTACTLPTDCLSGFCTEGVCCNAQSCGSCQSCALANTRGTCTPVAAGSSDPAAVCTMMAVSTCGTTGVCDGSGQCARYAVGTACLPSTCPLGTAARTDWACNAAGSCISTLIDCHTYSCDPATNSCRTTCTDSTDCANGSTCMANLCQ